MALPRKYCGWFLSARIVIADKPAQIAACIIKSDHLRNPFRRNLDKIRNLHTIINNVSYHIVP